MIKEERRFDKRKFSVKVQLINENDYKVINKRNYLNKGERFNDYKLYNDYYDYYDDHSDMTNYNLDDKNKTKSKNKSIMSVENRDKINIKKYNNKKENQDKVTNKSKYKYNIKNTKNDEKTISINNSNFNSNKDYNLQISSKSFSIKELITSNNNYKNNELEDSEIIQQQGIEANNKDTKNNLNKANKTPISYAKVKPKNIFKVTKSKISNTNMIIPMKNNELNKEKNEGIREKKYELDSVHSVYTVISNLNKDDNNINSNININKNINNQENILLSMDKIPIYSDNSKKISIIEHKQNKDRDNSQFTDINKNQSNISNASISNDIKPRKNAIRFMNKKNEKIETNVYFIFNSKPFQSTHREESNKNSKRNSLQNSNNQSKISITESKYNSLVELPHNQIPKKIDLLKDDLIYYKIMDIEDIHYLLYQIREYIFILDKIKTGVQLVKKRNKVLRTNDSNKINFEILNSDYKRKQNNINETGQVEEFKVYKFPHLLNLDPQKIVDDKNYFFITHDQILEDNDLWDKFVSIEGFTSMDCHFNYSIYVVDDTSFERLILLGNDYENEDFNIIIKKDRLE